MIKQSKPISKYTGGTVKSGVSKHIKTVGQLKKILETYPDKLPLFSPHNKDKGLMLVWYNIGDKDEHLATEESEGNCWYPGEF